MTTAHTLVAAFCIVVAVKGVTSQMTTSAPKSVTGAAQVVSDVGSKATDMALAPTSDPFGIFTEGYDSSNYGTFDYNMTDYSQYDGSAYNQCINVSETFELFAPVNLSVSVRGCILHSAAKAHLSPQIFQDLLNATAKSAPDSKAASLLAGIGNYSLAVPLDDALKSVSVSALKANKTLLQKTVDQYIFKLPALEDLPDVVLNASMAIGQALEPYMQVIEPQVAASAVSLLPGNGSEYYGQYADYYSSEPLPYWTPICGGGLLLLLNAALKAIA